MDIKLNYNEKYCGTCKEIKLKEDFNKNKCKSDGLNSLCRICSNLRSKKYYSENLTHHRKVIRKRNIQLKLNNQIKLFNYLKNNPCVDCNENNIVVLEFDHKDNVEKIMNVSKLIGGYHKWDKIKEEIDKCDVRCSNCHKIRTAKQQGWYKNLIDLGLLNNNYK